MSVVEGGIMVSPHGFETILCQTSVSFSPTWIFSVYWCLIDNFVGLTFSTHGTLHDSATTTGEFFLLSLSRFTVLILCFEKICLKFGIVLYETLKVFLFKTWFNLCSVGKQVSTIFMVLAPTFVLAFNENGGMNHVIFCFLVNF